MKVKGASIGKGSIVIPGDLPQILEQSVLRAPGDTEFLAFRETLRDDERPFAHRIYQMACLHRMVPLTVDPTNGEATIVTVQCERCRIVLHKSGKINMLTEEWNRHCPDGYDMWEWRELFTKDKPMWRYIHDEVQEELVTDYRGE